MNRKLPNIFKAFLLFFFVATLGLGCSSDSDDASDNYEPLGNPLDALSDDELLEKGKQSLAEFNYAAADECFNARLERLPDDPQATYGLVLSDVQHLGRPRQHDTGPAFRRRPLQVFRNHVSHGDF